ncbi:MAG: hypothetical protein KME45_11145 [Stenomitos rutilans HA7619-LM2]|nr:hypothetical protein [Stenomitos rutilans HA7619-LM2]
MVAAAAATGVIVVGVVATVGAMVGVATVGVKLAGWIALLSFPLAVVTSVITGCELKLNDLLLSAAVYSCGAFGLALIFRFQRFLYDRGDRLTIRPSNSGSSRDGSWNSSSDWGSDCSNAGDGGDCGG